MTSGTEQQLTILGSEGRIVHIGCYGIRTGFLLAHTYIIFYVIATACFWQNPVYQFLE